MKWNFEYFLSVVRPDKRLNWMKRKWTEKLFKFITF